MPKNLFDFGDENLKDEEKIENLERKVKENINTANAKEIFDKYKNYSKEDLMQEFLNVSKQKISNGEMSKENLNNTISKLMPFVNSSQAEFLKGLINKID